MLVLKAQLDKNNISLDSLFSGLELVVDISLQKDNNIVWNYLLPYQEFLHKPVTQDNLNWEHKLLNYLVTKDPYLGYILYTSEQDLLIDTTSNNITIPSSRVSSIIKTMIGNNSVSYLEVWYTRTTRTFIHTRYKNKTEQVENSTQVGICVIGKHNYVYNANDIADKLEKDTLSCVLNDTTWLKYSNEADILHGLINDNNLCVICNGERVDTKHFLSLCNNSVESSVLSFDKTVEVANNVKDVGKTVLDDFKLYNKVESSTPSLKKNKKNIGSTDCCSGHSEDNHPIPYAGNTDTVHRRTYNWMKDMDIKTERFKI